MTHGNQPVLGEDINKPVHWQPVDGHLGIEFERKSMIRTEEDENSQSIENQKEVDVTDMD